MTKDYLTIQQTAEKWNLRVRRVQRMCYDGEIPGVFKIGRSWAIPADAERPVDRRVTTGEYKDWRKKYGKTKQVCK